jgi:hypothetical protein
MDINTLFESLLPKPADSRSLALDLIRAYPNLSPAELVVLATKKTKRRAATTGFVSGLFGNPFAMLPAAAVDIFAVLKAEAALAGLVAALIDPETLDDEDVFQTDVIAILFPAVISNVLQAIGAHAGQHASKVLIRRYISKRVLKFVIRTALKYLGIKLTQRALIAKTVPLVGAFIGGTWNWFEVKHLGRRALRYHQGEEIPIPPDHDLPLASE